MCKGVVSVFCIYKYIHIFLLIYFYLILTHAVTGSWKQTTWKQNQKAQRNTTHSTRSFSIQIRINEFSMVPLHSMSAARSILCQCRNFDWVRANSRVWDYLVMYLPVSLSPPLSLSLSPVCLISSSHSFRSVFLVILVSSNYCSHFGQYKQYIHCTVTVLVKNIYSSHVNVMHKASKFKPLE